MALTMLQRVQLLTPKASPLLSSLRLLSTATAHQEQQHACVVCLWTSSRRCSVRHGCRRAPWLQHLPPPASAAAPGRRGVCSMTVRDPLLGVSGAVHLHRDSPPDGGVRLLLAGLAQGSKGDEQEALKKVSSCSSSRQLLRFLRSSSLLSDSVAATALHRLADLEQDGAGGLKDPAVLKDEALRSLCQRLEQESSRLGDRALVSALLACTRLYLDPWSRLLVRLVSESQVRLDEERLGVLELCTLAQALLALEGPDGTMLGQTMAQLQHSDPARWSLDELAVAYEAFEAGVAEGGRYQDLLNTMHGHALSVAARLEPAAVSKILGALVATGQSQALPLVIALCKQAVRHVPVFTDSQLTTVLSALIHFGHSDHFLVQALELHFAKRAFTAHPETVTRVMQYFGRRRVWSPAVFDAVAESFVYRADDYSTSQAARQLEALGRLGYVPPNAARLFRKVETLLHTRYSQFQPRVLLQVLHACTLLQRFPLNFVSKVFSPYFLQQLQEKESGMDRIVLAQLTQLYMTVKLECPFYNGPQLLPKYRLKSFLMPGRSLETTVDMHLYNAVKTGLVDLLGARSYFASKVLTQFCYTLDVEIKLDEEGYVLPASHIDEIHKRIAVCINGPKRFAVNAHQLLGQEAIKQRHLRSLGYEVVEIPYYEFEKLRGKAEIVDYLHKKIFPLSYRLSW
ncbi:FAST kinase domain-containing protein 3, mitochondrial [Engraulis encrasicolus]|uniref:FAST kinase domain-containing protein 3, mitochondrial n=1 Tax=Engraulis encrasicolus TaxID=184585 RepID=UPI002FD68D2F